VSKLSHRLARINETVREMDKLGTQRHPRRQHLCATNGDNVTVHIIDLDEVSELCLMARSNHFLIGCGQLNWYLDKAYAQFQQRKKVWRSQRS
jgi:hypothetical protein